METFKNDYIRQDFISKKETWLHALEGEYKKGSEKHEAITSLYWSVTVVIYLAWSFLTGDWHITWIVWVIAGVLSSALDLIKLKK